MKCRPCGVVQHVVHINSSRFGNDFRNELRLGPLRRCGDRSLLEDFFEVGDLQGFSGAHASEGTKRDFRAGTHSLDSIVNLV